jgi:hypothetical protein
VRDLVQLVFGARTVKMDRLRGNGLEVIGRVGDDQQMATTIRLLLVIAIPAFFFHQTMNEVPIRFVLGAIRTGKRLFAQIETEASLRLRVHGEHVRKDVIGFLVLPYPGVLSEFQEIQPGCKPDLAEAQLAIASQTFRRMHVTIDRQIASIRLLHPEGGRLCNQFLEFDVVAHRDQVDRVFITSTQPLARDDALRKQDIVTKDGGELE